MPIKGAEMAKRGRKAKKGAGKKAAKGRRRVVSRLDQAEIAELRAALDKKMCQLADEKERLLARVAEIDRLTGGKAAAPARPKAVKGRKVGRPAKVAKVRQVRGGPTLGNRLEQLLKDAPKPMRVLQLLEAVKESGYPSKSPHLRSMVNQTLSRDPRFRKVRRGTYKLA